MGNTWLTSDLHLGHEKVAQLRGFDSIAQHDAMILDNLARANRAGDVWYLLGDLVMGHTKVEILGTLSEIFEGSDVHVILGNHDRPHPCNHNSVKYLSGWNYLFDSVSTTATLRYEGQTYLLSHFPYEGEGVDRVSGEERYTQWRLKDLGAPLLHGHTHDTVRLRYSSAGTAQHHCGIDAWGLKPVTLPTLLRG